MTLTGRDAVATLLTACVGAITYAKLNGFDWPFLYNWHSATLLVFILGMTACIVGGNGSMPGKNTWTVGASLLGGLAFVLVIAGIFVDSKAIFIALSADIIALWAVTTLHHVLE